MSDKFSLDKWRYENNYIGKDYSDYYILYSHHRDSDILNESNYQGLKGMFIDLNGVIEICSNHWAVGWVETILIHKSAEETIKKGIEILERLSDYPVLDEEDFSNREYDLVSQYADDVMNEIDNAQGYFCSGYWVDEDIPEYLVKDGFNKDMTRDEVIDNIYDKGLIDY